MNFKLDDVSSFSEEQLVKLMRELEKNPLIIVPHYLLKSEIVELLMPLLNKVPNESEFLEIKNTIEDNLYKKIKDSLEHNLEDWLN